MDRQAHRARRRHRIRRDKMKFFAAVTRPIKRSIFSRINMLDIISVQPMTARCNVPMDIRYREYNA